MRPDVHEKNAAFPVAQSLDRFDAGAPLAERFPTAEALFMALRAEDPTVQVFSRQWLLRSGDVPTLRRMAAPAEAADVDGSVHGEGAG